MFVSEVMSKCVSECTEDMNLEDVFALITKCDHGVVVVVDSNVHRVPIGIVNERSICEQLIARGRNPRNLTAGSVIDPRITKMRETDIIDGGDGMTDVSAIIVVDENRRVCGVVSKDELRKLARPTEVQDAKEQYAMPAKIALRKVSEIPGFGWIQ